MKLGFNSFKVTLVVCPMDMRSGFRRLNGVCSQLLDIDLTQGKDLVVFLSKNLKVAKIVFSDDKGSNLLTRHLHEGHYQRLLMAAEAKAMRPLTVCELEKYLDGQSVEVERHHIFKN